MNISKWYPHLLCFSTSDIYFRSVFLLFMCALFVSVSEQGQIILLFWQVFFFFFNRLSAFFLVDE